MISLGDQPGGKRGSHQGPCPTCRVPSFSGCNEELLRLSNFDANTSSAERRQSHLLKCLVISNKRRHVTSCCCVPQESAGASLCGEIGCVVCHGGEVHADVLMFDKIWGFPRIQIGCTVRVQQRKCEGFCEANVFRLILPFAVLAEPAGQQEQWRTTGCSNEIDTSLR